MKGFRLLLVPVLFFFAASNLSAISYTWNGTTGNWTDAARWTPIGVPGAGDDATVGGGTVSLTAPASITNLTLTGGTLNGDFNLTIGGTMTWNGGQLGTAPGTITVGGLLTIATSANHLLRAKKLIMNGGGNWTGGTVFMSEGAILRNAAGQTFTENTASGTLNNGFGFPGARTFENLGTFDRNGTGTLSVDLFFSNTGTLKGINTILFQSTSTNTGTIAPGTSAGILNLPAGYTNTPFAKITTTPALPFGSGWTIDYLANSVVLTYCQRWYADTDNDGYSNPAVSKISCLQPAGYLADLTDCDDANMAIHPGVAETCNGLDDNCDGQIDEGFALLTAVKVFLQGPYVSSAQLMHDSLRVKGLIPLQEPYTGLSGFTHVGGGGEQTTPAVSVPVDSSYFPVVRHRNHLGVQLGEAVLYPPCMATETDFRATPPQGFYAFNGLNPAQKLIGSTYVLWAGNGRIDFQLKYNGSNNDRNAVLSVVGLNTPNAVVPGYNLADYNLDGVVKYNGSANDRNVLLGNVGIATPSAVVWDQVA